MNLKEHIKDVAQSYFISVTLINVAVFVTGMIFRPEDRFGYDAMLLPLIYGALTVIPSLVMYSKKELSVRQMIVRKMIQLVMDVVIILAVIFGDDEFTAENVKAAFAVGLSIAVVFVLVNIIIWLLDKRTADRLNEQLSRFQERNSDTAT